MILNHEEAVLLARLQDVWKIGNDDERWDVQDTFRESSTFTSLSLEELFHYKLDHSKEQPRVYHRHVIHLKVYQSPSVTGTSPPLLSHMCCLQ